MQIEITNITRKTTSDKIGIVIVAYIFSDKSVETSVASVVNTIEFPSTVTVAEIDSVMLEMLEKHILDEANKDIIDSNVDKLIGKVYTAV